MTKNQIINKVIENYNNICAEYSKGADNEFKNLVNEFFNKVINNIWSGSYKKPDELKYFINEFPSIENLFNEDKFDSFCKYIVEHPLHNHIDSPLALLCGYMFKTHMNTTINNWPDSYENLVDSLHYWSYSSDILY